MTESTDKPRFQARPGVLGAILGDQAAHYQEVASEIALRTAQDNERHTRWRNKMMTMWYAIFFAAGAFGVVMGCLAMWNAVVG